MAPEELLGCYRECGGNLERMSTRLEVSVRALRRRIADLDLDLDRSGSSS